MKFHEGSIPDRRERGYINSSPKEKKSIFFIDIRHVILKGERRDWAGEREREVRKKWRGGERDATYILIFFLNL